MLSNTFVDATFPLQKNPEDFLSDPALLPDDQSYDLILTGTNVRFSEVAGATDADILIALSL